MMRTTNACPRTGWQFLWVIVCLFMNSAAAAGPILLDQTFDPLAKNISHTIGLAIGLPAPRNLDVGQTFTVGFGGILSSVDVMVGRGNTGITDPLLLDIRTTTGGVPSASNSGAKSTNELSN